MCCSIERRREYLMSWVVDKRMKIERRSLIERMGRVANPRATKEF